MKIQKKAAWFISVALCSVLLSSTVIPAMAALMEQKLTVHTGVQVYVDDMKLDAGDTHGNPDAFIYNGTTYVAVAAVSKSLGQDVLWDGNTKSVYIGEHAGASYNLLTVCPPYQTKYYEEYTTVTMANQKYANAISVSDYGFALYNLNGKYDTLSFYAGHIDGTPAWDSTCNIYLDGELALSVDLDAEALPERYTLDLNGALQMKIEGSIGSQHHALADLKLS